MEDRSADAIVRDIVQGYVMGGVDTTKTPTELGVDSIGIVEMCLDIEDAFDMVLSSEAIQGRLSIDDIVHEVYDGHRCTH